MTKHGMRYTRIYGIWCGMKTRCKTKSVKDYPAYGGRGISYSKEWESFSSFYRDMRQGYKSNLTLERINNSKGYSKENCKWATRKEQNNNKIHGYLKRIRKDNGTFAGKTYKAKIVE